MEAKVIARDFHLSDKPDEARIYELPSLWITNKGYCLAT